MLGFIETTDLSGLMDPISTFFAHVAFVQMATCVLLLSANWKSNRSALLFSLLTLCGCGYLINEVFGTSELHSIGWWLEYNTGNALPGVFWLVSLSIFSDHYSIKKTHYFIASLTLVLPLISTLLQLIFNFDLHNFPAFWGLLTYGVMALELALISHALYVAIEHWKADLIENRRYMRLVIISSTALYFISVILSEQLFHVDWVWREPIKYFLLSALSLSVNYLLFSLKQGTLFDLPVSQPVTIQKSKASSPELLRILNSMNDEKLYRQDGITISGLSRHLSIHEYKLRHLINKELEYRNFNDFLNDYRIREVAGKLSTGENQRIPVLTLALDSGFRSLSSFNKAFKEKHCMTPTEYRNHHLPKNH